MVEVLDLGVERLLERSPRRAPAQQQQHRAALGVLEQQREPEVGPERGTTRPTQRDAVWADERSLSW